MRNCTQAGTRKTSPFSSSSAGCPGIPRVWERNMIFYSLSKTVSKLSCSARCQAFCVPELWSYCDTDRPFPYWSDFNEHRSAASMTRQPWKAERCINSWRVFNGGLISAGHFKEPLEEELFARGADDEAPWIDCVGFMHSDATLYTDGSRKPKKRKASSLRTQSSEKTALLYAHISTSYWSQCIPSCVAWLKKAVCFQSLSHGTKFPRKEMWRVKADSSIHSFDAQIW